MDALICLEPGKLEVAQKPAPEIRPGEVLVRPRRAGICGTDFHIFEGKHPFLQYPRIIGHELAVEVVEAPTGARLSAGEIYVVNPYLSCGHCIACRSGKPNCCVRISVLGVHQDGGMAELLSVPSANLIPAQGMTLDECATVEFLAIGAHAVRRGAVGEGDSVLVVGAGPIGLGVALFASLSGADVTVVDRDPERAAAAQAILKVRTIPTDEDLPAAVSELTGGDLFAVVFDATGSAPAMERGFDFVSHGGRYVLVSVVKNSIAFMDPDFHKKEMTLFASRNATNTDFRLVIDAIRDGSVPIERLITHRTSLAEAVNDIPLWATRKTGLIKALVEID
jgi:2-desacetyl-2-hydroxyethyl bacteriochlorophyllide A dehydrogenase